MKAESAVPSLARALAAATLVVSLIAACSGNDLIGGAKTDHRPDRDSSSSTTTASASTTPDHTAPSTTTPSTHLVESVCKGRADITDLGVVTAPEITEASGIVASRRDPGVWWINNDSGDSARIFAFSEAGALLATVEIPNVRATDWEDIASDGDSIFIADTGDNLGTRDSVIIYAIETPSITSGGDGSAKGSARRIDVTATKLTLTYPDGAHDAEALAFDPISGDLFVITKDWSMKGVSGVYRTSARPLSPSDRPVDGSDQGNGTSGTAELERVGDLSLPAGTLVTGADISPDGRLVAVRSYTSVNLFRRPPDIDVATALESVPCEAPLPPEFQGESIGFSADGSSYVTLSEGSGQTLHRTHG